VGDLADACAVRIASLADPCVRRIDWSILP
jgi:hypothetical protein